MTKETEQTQDFDDLEPVFLSDGRKLRGARTKERIVAAILSLVREGDLQPGMARIARRAGVSERTLFRHYDQRLHLAAIDQALDILRGRMLLPFRGATPMARMTDLIARRAASYEQLRPLLAARARVGDLGAELGGIVSLLVAHERQRLALALGADIPAGSALFEALDVAVSFHTWERLRSHQGLDPDAATGVVTTLVERLLTTAEPANAPT